MADSAIATSTASPWTGLDFRNLVDSIGDYAIFVLDPMGIVRSWNKGAQRIKGYAAAEIIGRHFSTFYRREDVAAGFCEHELDVALREGRFEDTGWRVRKDGSQFWANVVITALRNERGEHTGFAKVTRDLTDHAFRVFAEAANSIVWCTDAEGRPSADSPGWRAFTGQTEEQWRGNGALDAVHPEDRPQLEREWSRARAEGRVFEQDVRLRDKDGAYVWMSIRAVPLTYPDGRIREWFGITSDISARKRADDERDILARAGDELLACTDYRNALATVASLAVPRIADWVGVDIVTSRSGDAVFTEQLAVAHVDPAKVAYARELSRRYPPDPRASAGVPNVARTGRPEIYREIPHEMLIRGVRDEEHRRILEQLQLKSALVVPLKGRESVFGTITFVYAESNRRYNDADLVLVEELARRAAVVIERRKLEEERNLLLESESTARKQAELANRSKDEFLAVVSHELRNPLSVVLGRVQLMLQKKPSAELKRHLHTIERSARAQLRLIEDVLDVSRIINRKLRLTIARVDGRQSIEDAVAASRALAAAKDVGFELKLGSPLELSADPVRLQQIVTNLVSNAVKFTPEGGSVFLEATRVDSQVRIVVGDTGEGIPPDALEKIFEPFQQADASTTRRHGGLGLGLTIVRELVMAHGGSVKAESPGVGRGATFTVELPVDGFAPLEAGTPQVRLPATPLRGTRVLAVDDSPDALELLAEILCEAGAKVETAGSAAAALEKLARIEVDVLVTDIGMPVEDGYHLLERARALPGVGETLPAIALTAYARPEDVELSLQRGFQAHLSKPIEPNTLVRRVATLRRRHGHRPASSR